MSNYYVELTVTMHPGVGDLESVIDPLMDAFDTMYGVDVDLGLDLHLRILTVSVYLDASTADGAINGAATATRTAFQTVGIPEPDIYNPVTVERVDLIA